MICRVNDVKIAEGCSKKAAMDCHAFVLIQSIRVGDCELRRPPIEESYGTSKCTRGSIAVAHDGIYDMKEAAEEREL
jgi:hypothetical protein